jgi:hypothetical protein
VAEYLSAVRSMILLGVGAEVSRTPAYRVQEVHRSAPSVQDGA